MARTSSTGRTAATTSPPGPNQKDLTTITNQNGVDFRPDDCGDTLATARYLWIAPGNTVTNQQGLIETPGEIDAFRFKTTGGAVNLTVTTATLGINLDIKADIVNAATSAVVFTSNSTSTPNATISTTLPAGEYLLRITGDVGRHARRPPAAAIRTTAASVPTRSMARSPAAKPTRPSPSRKTAPTARSSAPSPRARSAAAR